jgi:hypothetical protein
MNRAPNSPDDRARARNAARRTVFTLARDSGAQVITRSLFPGEDTTVNDVEPLAGARAARALELGARYSARGYIRAARETGQNWRQIGEALGLVPGGDADQAGETLAEAAYTYATGSPTTETAIKYGRSFIWRCPSCDNTIGDRGICNGPADDEIGHTESCLRLATAISRWDAEWEAEP